MIGAFHVRHCWNSSRARPCLVFGLPRHLRSSVGSGFGFIRRAVFLKRPPSRPLHPSFYDGDGQFYYYVLPALYAWRAVRKIDERFSGAAQAIALGIVKKLGTKHAILAIVFSCAVLTYGGVSLFVVAFAMYPITVRIFVQSDIPKRLIPATIALGSFTFIMTALPESPAIQNTIPMPTFGTNAFAAPGLGIIAAIIMLAVGYAWIIKEAHKARRAGEGYGHAENKSHKPEGVLH